VSLAYDVTGPHTTGRDVNVESIIGFEDESDLDDLAADRAKEPLRIPLDRIPPSTRRLRRKDETVIDGLVLSIKHCGLLQPIMVALPKLPDCQKDGFLRLPILSYSWSMILRSESG
jgi:hypothetical protein